MSIFHWQASWAVECLSRYLAESVMSSLMHLLHEPSRYTGSGHLPKIEVGYALLERQFLKSLDVKLGASVSEAINLSGVLEEFPEINLDINPVGIYSKKVTLDSVVKNGDRIEIYRALRVSPKEARRLRAKKKQSKRS